MNQNWQLTFKYFISKRYSWNNAITEFSPVSAIYVCSVVGRCTVLSTYMQRIQVAFKKSTKHLEEAIHSTCIPIIDIHPPRCIYIYIYISDIDTNTDSYLPYVQTSIFHSPGEFTDQPPPSATVTVQQQTVAISFTESLYFVYTLSREM